MARTPSLIRVSYPFHVAVEGELRRHAARTGIAAAEIIRRSYDLYMALMHQYGGTIPPEMVQPAVQPDGSAYPNTTKRITFYIDPYLNSKLKDWPDQEAHLLGYAVLCYIGLWAAMNPDQAADPGFTYAGEGAVEAVSSSVLPTPNGEDTEAEPEPEPEPDGETFEASNVEEADKTAPSTSATARQGSLPERDQADIAGDEEEIFTEAPPDMTHVDDQGEPTQDIHGNPIGTLYDAEGSITNLDRDGNLIVWDEHGYPEGTTYDQNGEPNNLDEDGFPITQQAAA